MIERQGLSKEDKQHILTRFKEHKALGAALLAVAAGSFGEGIDLPGDLLKMRYRCRHPTRKTQPRGKRSHVLLPR